MDTDALLARLQVLEDERAILQTLYQYGHSMDYGPDADFVDCFTNDGVWEVRMRKVPDGAFTCTGRDEITASLEAQTSVRAPALYAKHLLIEPRVVLDGDAASVDSYSARSAPRHDGPTQIVASGRYLDRLVRSGDGRWRFTHRVAEIDDM
jgi:ketosteroid isomerase-like protein